MPGCADRASAGSSTAGAGRGGGGRRPRADGTGHRGGLRRPGVGGIRVGRPGRACRRPRGRRGRAGPGQSAGRGRSRRAGPPTMPAASRTKIAGRGMSPGSVPVPTKNPSRPRPIRPPLAEPCDQLEQPEQADVGDRGAEQRHAPAGPDALAPAGRRSRPRSAAAAGASGPCRTTARPRCATVGEPALARQHERDEGDRRRRRRIAIPTSDRATSGLTLSPRGALIVDERRRPVAVGRVARRGRRAAAGGHPQTSTTTGKTIGRRFVCSYR